MISFTQNQRWLKRFNAQSPLGRSIERATDMINEKVSKPDPAGLSEVMAEILKELRLTREVMLEVLRVHAVHKGNATRMTESDAISWLVTHMQTATVLPSLGECARQIGVNRRSFHADKWGKFRAMYDKFVGMQRGIDKSRVVSAHEEEFEDDE